MQLHPTTVRRRIFPDDTTTAAAAANTPDQHDQLLLYATICNAEDLTPFVRKAFTSSRPETLLSHLKHYMKSKELEIENVCRAHNQDFITAVDDLRSLLSDVDSLKFSISTTSSIIQDVAVPLLAALDAYLEAQNQHSNITLAVNSLNTCVRLMELCSCANFHVSRNNFYMALKCLDPIEANFRDKTPSSALRTMLKRKIPAIRIHIEKKVSKEFGDWLVEVRSASRNLGQLAIGQASTTRQREEEFRIKQRQAEEQSRCGLAHCVYLLQEEDDDEIDGVVDGGTGGNGISGIDLTPLYMAYHIHQALGHEHDFKKYYFENRKLQLTSDFQVTSMTPFLESHQMFFAQIAGFFIVEDRVLRTGGGLISKMEVEHLWDTAVAKMCSVLDDQFLGMQTASHLLLIKDYVSLLGVTLRRYGYPIGALLDVLDKHRDKYHELLLSDCDKKFTEALTADGFEPMYMKKEYEYSMNVLSFQLQTSNVMPAFPYVAPFSSTVPNCCRIVRSFIEDSVSFMSYGGQLDFYDVVKKYLDKLLTEVFNEALSKVINDSIGGVNQAMQMAVNMGVFERACDYFILHTAQLSGIPSRLAERELGKRPYFPLMKAHGVAQDKLSALLKQKVDGFLKMMENVNWMADEPPQVGNEYANELIMFLETLVSTAQPVLPVVVLKHVLRDVLAHISDRILGALLGESVKKFNVNCLMGLDIDISLLEAFAENQGEYMPEDDADEVGSVLVELRQMVNLLLSNHPENYLNPVIRERSYNVLDHRKVVVVCEKLRDQGEGGYFSSFGTRNGKLKPKNKSLDVLVKRLKEVNS